MLTPGLITSRSKLIRQLPGKQLEKICEVPTFNSRTVVNLKAAQ